MKTKRKIFLGKNQEKKHRFRYHYGNYDISSGSSFGNSREVYKYHQDYRIYSQYKYISSTVKRPGGTYKKKHASRSGSPVLGSEEYMKKKIEQRSAIIMKQLLNPNEQPIENIKELITENESHNSIKSQKKCTHNEVTGNNSSKSKSKKSSYYNIAEIHDKIMNHITKLNDGKKKNLINSKISGYDSVIEQIQKQRRLEISRALRTMCSQSNEVQESADFINSIIPDIGIKIEDLPQNVIEELRNTLNIGLEDWSCDDIHSADTDSSQLFIGTQVNTQIMDDVSKDSAYESHPMEVYVKPEPLDDFNTSQENESYIVRCETPPNFIKNCTDNTNRSTVSMYCTEVCNIPNQLESPKVVKLEPIEDSLFTMTSETNCEYLNNVIKDSVNSGNAKPSYIKEKPSSVRSNYCQETIINTDSCLNSSDITYTKNIPESKQETVTYNNITTTNKLNDTFDQMEFPNICVKLEPIDDSDSKPTEANVSDKNCYQTTNSESKNIDHINCDSKNELGNISTLNTENEFCKSFSTNCCNLQSNLNITSNHTQTEYDTIDEKEEDINWTNQKNIHNRIKDLTKSTSTVSTQTNVDVEHYSTEDFVGHFIANYYKDVPKSMTEVISRMFEIDQHILKLTHYRQSLFRKLNSAESKSVGIDCNLDKEIHFKHKVSSSLESAITSKKRKKKLPKKSRKLKRMSNTADEISCLEQTYIPKDKQFPKGISSKKHKDRLQKTANDLVHEICRKNDVGINGKGDKSKEHLEEKNTKGFELVGFGEKVLVIKVREDKLVAGTESGKIIFCSLENGLINRTVNCCQLPITSLLFLKDTHNKALMYVGSLDVVLKIYNLNNYYIMGNVKLEDGIQCMEQNWGYIFIGGVRGYLYRYSLKKKVVEYEDKFSDSSILVLKATQEGARRVLLVGSRNAPVIIRDAMTGLYMRTMENVISPTVYSLIMEKSLIYCGTTNHDILVYSFHNGKLIHRFKATSSKGIGCMKIDRNLLFASCHDGNIYVYDIQKNVFLSAIEGPGGVILSMETFENQVIIGTISFKFVSLPIPQHILRHRIK